MLISVARIDPIMDGVDARKHFGGVLNGLATDRLVAGYGPTEPTQLP
jgi:hypothetical protein